jgi:4'-phosphopantetheinyl transferase
MLQVPEGASPAGGLLAENSVDVWHILLPADESDEENWMRVLSSDEKCRARRFRGRALSLRFVAGRATLRYLLARYTHTPPERLRFTYAPMGKPVLDPGGVRFPCTFNLSHSGNHLLVAVTRARDVGVDIERVRPLPDASSMVERFFSRHEQEVYFALPAARRRAAFFRCWTRKEAFVKMVGNGLNIPFDSFTVSFAGDEPPAIITAPGYPLLASWSVHHLQPALGYTGALVVACPAVRVSTRSIDPAELLPAR